LDIGNLNKLLALAFGALKELGFEVWFWERCDLYQCFASTFRIVAKFTRRKSGNILPLVHYNTQNTIFTKLLLWEYGNKGAPFSRKKSSRVLCLVQAHQQGFMLVYTTRVSMFVQGWVEAHQRKKTCWRMSQTWENQCHL